MSALRSFVPGTLVLLIGAVVVACSPPSDTCRTNGDCRSGTICVAQHCVPNAGDASDRTTDAVSDDFVVPDANDGGTPADASDASVLGRRCSVGTPCPAGFRCEGGTCAVDCGTNARCGTDRCCAAGEVCYLDACTAPGMACGGSASCGGPGRCPAGQQCDPTLGHCMSTPSAATCEYRPTSTFSPRLLWSWTGSSRYPTFGHIMSTPLVADIDGDGVSDIIVGVSDRITGDASDNGILCALSGAGDCTGGPREIFCTDPAGPRINWSATPAVADLDGTGSMTIVVPNGETSCGGWCWSGVAAYDAHGARIAAFGTDSSGAAVNVPETFGAITIADLDRDGHAEVIMGFTVFDSHGRLLWQRPTGGVNRGFGPITVAADLDGDGRLEVVGGNAAYRADGTDAWPTTAAIRSAADGFPGIADFDHDGQPEVVVVSNGSIAVFDHTGERFSTNTMTIAGTGGPPTMADLDGDHVPDIAVAGASSLTAFRVGTGTGHPMSQLWTTASRDFSSNFTGSSVFDFDGDGRAEVIYADECFARVYDGPGDRAGGTRTLFEVPNTSCTATEYPVVADVTGDGKAEFIVVANDATHDAVADSGGCVPAVTGCSTVHPGTPYEPTHGVRVYRDANDNWVATRSIWSEHSYHVTNVCDGLDSVCPAARNLPGAVPTNELPNWSYPTATPLNSYRVNAQLTNALGAPDLVPRNFTADLSGCDATLGLQVSVVNLGSIGAPAGIPIAFSRVTGSGRSLIDVGHTRSVLLPGASEIVNVPWNPVPADARDVPLEIEVRVDDDGTGHGMVNECNETNNTATIHVTCGTIG